MAFLNISVFQTLLQFVELEMLTHYTRYICYNFLHVSILLRKIQLYQKAFYCCFYISYILVCTKTLTRFYIYSQNHQKKHAYPTSEVSQRNTDLLSSQKLKLLKAMLNFPPSHLNLISTEDQFLCFHSLFRVKGIHWLDSLHNVKLREHLTKLKGIDPFKQSAVTNNGHFCYLFFLRLPPTFHLLLRFYFSLYILYCLRVCNDVLVA